MARVKTYSNGGSLFPADLNSLQDDYEPSFSTWKPVGPPFGGYITGGQSAGSFVLPIGGRPANNTNGSGGGTFWFDPADYAGASPTVARVAKVRFRVAWMTDAVAPAVSFTVALAPVTAVAGTASVTTFTYGAATALTTTITTPAASSMGVVTSADLTPPAAGAYAWLVSYSSVPAAASCINFNVRMLARQV